MDKHSKDLLSQWQLLESGGGLKRSGSMVRILWIAGLLLCIVVVFGICYGLHPVVVAIAAVAMGWVIAERNALRTRLSQWPILRRYIDWKRVQEDLTDNKEKSQQAAPPDRQ